MWIAILVNLWIQPVAEYSQPQPVVQPNPIVIVVPSCTWAGPPQRLACP